MNRQSNLISQDELTPDWSYFPEGLTPDWSYFPEGLTLKLVPTSHNKIYEHKIDFKLRERERERERERLHMRKQQIGWKRERDSAREQGKERAREKRTNQVSRSQIGRS